MKVLVTGATGFVGSTLVAKALKEKKLEVRVLARDPRSKNARRLAAMGAELAAGDVLDPTSLDEALDDGTIDAVIHLVGIIAQSAERTFKRLHYLATKNVVAAAERAGVTRYVHMSAMGAGPESTAAYHKTKWAAEEAVRASTLDWTIFRPSIVTGPEDLFVNRFALFATLPFPVQPFIPLPNWGKTKFQPVAVNDVAEVFLRALDTPASIGKSYDVGGPDVVTLSQLVKGVEKSVGAWKPKAPFPIGVAALMSRFLQFLPYPFDLNPVQVEMMRTDNVGDIAPLKKDFGIEPTPFLEGISFLSDGKPKKAPAAPKPKPAKPAKPAPAPAEKKAEKKKAEEPKKKPATPEPEAGEAAAEEPKATVKPAAAPEPKPKSEPKAEPPPKAKAKPAPEPEPESADDDAEEGDDEEAPPPKVTTPSAKAKGEKKPSKSGSEGSAPAKKKRRKKK